MNEKYLLATKNGQVSIYKLSKEVSSRIVWNKNKQPYGNGWHSFVMEQKLELLYGDYIDEADCKFAVYNDLRETVMRAAIYIEAQAKELQIQKRVLDEAVNDIQAWIADMEANNDV